MALGGQQIKQMKISQNFIDKFKKDRQSQQVPQADVVKIKQVEKTKNINDIIDKQKFAEKLVKLQKDIELRN